MATGLEAGWPAVLAILALLLSCCAAQPATLSASSVNRPDSFWAGAQTHVLAPGDDLPALLDQITADGLMHVVTLPPGPFDAPLHQARLNVTSHIQIVGAGADVTQLMARGHKFAIRINPGATFELRGLTIVGLVLDFLELVGTPGEVGTVVLANHAVAFYTDLKFIGVSDDVDVTQLTTFLPNTPGVCASTTPCVTNYDSTAWKYVLAASQSGTLVLGSVADVDFGGTGVTDMFRFPAAAGPFAFKWGVQLASASAEAVTASAEIYSLFVCTNMSTLVDPSIPVMRTFFSELQALNGSAVGSTTCYNPYDAGFSYRGSANTTVDGSPCLDWDDPRITLRFFLPNVPGTNFTSVEGNLCRNPRSSVLVPPGPWCYALQAGAGVKAVSCGVPACDASPASKRSNDHTLAIALGAAAGTAALVLVIAAVVAAALWRRRRRRRLGKSEEAATGSLHAADEKAALRLDDGANAFGLSGRDRMFSANAISFNADSTQVATSTLHTLPDTTAADPSQAATHGVAAGTYVAEPPQFRDERLQRSIVAERGAEASVIHRVCGLGDAPADDRVQLLEAQLDALLAASEPFLGRYQLLSAAHRRVGGQGVVQFARDGRGHGLPVAIKFFTQRNAFRNERAHYANPALAHILPPVADVVGNEDGAVQALGRPLPPMVVTERGEPLDEWARRCRPDFSSSMNIILHIVERVAELHRAGIAHRDLKYSNTIFLYSRNEWTILDFGSAALIGTEAPLSFSLRWAAPETVMALVRRERIVTADSAVDVWSVGVMAFELLTGVPACRSADRDQIVGMMVGAARLPWEEVDSPTHEALMRKLGFMRDVVMRMLDRDPARRIALDEALREWHRVLNYTAVPGRGGRGGDAPSLGAVTDITPSSHIDIATVTQQPATATALTDVSVASEALGWRRQGPGGAASLAEVRLVRMPDGVGEAAGQGGAPPDRT